MELQALLSQILAQVLSAGALKSLQVAAFSADEFVDANRRRETVEPVGAAVLAAAAVPDVVAVRGAEVALAGVVCLLAGWAFHAAALSAAADAMSVADEVAEDARQAAQAVRCPAVLDGLLVARDAPHQAVRGDPHQVAQDDPWPVAPVARRGPLVDPDRDVQADLCLDGLRRVGLVARLADQGDCCQGDLGARLQAAVRRDEVVGASLAVADAMRAG